jgi:hypothetical protein
MVYFTWIEKSGMKSEMTDGRMAQSRPFSSEEVAEDNANARRSLDQHWLCSPQFPLSPL